MYQAYLEAIRKDMKDSGLGKFQPPASEQEILRLRTSSLAEFGTDIPDGYIAFLRITNGLLFGSVCIYASSSLTVDAGTYQYELPGFVESTLEWRSMHDPEDFLVFAESDMDIYTYNLVSGKYEVFDRGARDRLLATYHSFDGLITDALWTSLPPYLEANFPGSPPVQRPWPVD